MTYVRDVAGYFMFLYAVFSCREKWKVYFWQTLEECVTIGVDSVFIIGLVSFFMGAVTCIQLRYNLRLPISADFLVAAGVRNAAIVELAPTVMGIIFAGRTGANITSRLGSMRISEQIDALETMGISTPAYLVFPKIMAALITFPLLVIISAFLAIYGGLLAGKFLVAISVEDYIQGLKFMFRPYIIPFALCKALLFAFLISSISSYRGFYVVGGASEVGKASTKAVTNCCVAILLTDFLITHMFLPSSVQV